MCLTICIIIDPLRKEIQFGHPQICFTIALLTKVFSAFAIRTAPSKYHKYYFYKNLVSLHFRKVRCCLRGFFCTWKITGFRLLVDFHLIKMIVAGSPMEERCDSCHGIKTIESSEALRAVLTLMYFGISETVFNFKKKLSPYYQNKVCTESYYKYQMLLSAD